MSSVKLSLKMTYRKISYTPHTSSVKAMRNFLVATCIFFLTCANSLASGTHHPTIIGQILNIRITENAQGLDNADCASFIVTPAKLTSFLQSAILITGRQNHDWFLYGPCYARGTISTKYETWHWEFRNLGTATITSTSGDDTFFLADPRQESSLADE